MPSATLDKHWLRYVTEEQRKDFIRWLSDPCKCVWVLTDYGIEVEPADCHYSPHVRRKEYRHGPTKR